MRRPTTGLLVALLAFCAVCCAFSLGAASAQAETYEPPEIGSAEPSIPAELQACPVYQAGPSEPENQVVEGVWALIQRVRLQCLALAARQELLFERDWWIVSELHHRGEVGPTHATDVASEELLAEIEERLKSLEGSAGEPRHVVLDGEATVHNAASAEYNEHIVSAVDASGEATKGGLWFIGGAIVALIVGFAIWRVGSLRG